MATRLGMTCCHTKGLSRSRFCSTQIFNVWKSQCQRGCRKSPDIGVTHHKSDWRNFTIVLKSYQPYIVIIYWLHSPGKKERICTIPIDNVLGIGMSKAWNESRFRSSLLGLIKTWIANMKLLTWGCISPKWKPHSTWFAFIIFHET